jgi:tetratricopeptide (TPR) repeat protein
VYVAEAEPFYKRCLAITENALGADHPQVGTLLGSLGSFYRVQNRYAEAERLFRRSLAIAKRHWAPTTRRSASR